MKVLILPLVLTIIVIATGCNKDHDLLTINGPEEDLITTKVMNEAYVMAEMYNDSLEHCRQNITQCSRGPKHFDSMYHHFNNVYMQHHNQLIHNNMRNCDTMNMKCDSTRTHTGNCLNSGTGMGGTGTGGGMGGTGMGGSGTGSGMGGTGNGGGMGGNGGSGGGMGGRK